MTFSFWCRSITFESRAELVDWLVFKTNHMMHMQIYFVYNTRITMASQLESTSFPVLFLPAHVMTGRETLGTGWVASKRNHVESQQKNSLKCVASDSSTSYTSFPFKRPTLQPYTVSFPQTLNKLFIENWTWTTDRHFKSVLNLKMIKNKETHPVKLERDQTHGKKHSIKRLE